MPTPEGYFKGKCSKMWESIPGLWLWNTHDTYKKGLPDQIGSCFGKLFAFELKVKAAVDPLQRVELHRIARSGAFAGVLRDRNGTIVFTRYRSNSVDDDLTFSSIQMFSQYFQEQMGQLK